MVKKREKIAAIVLAAGCGKRMKSTIPKVLHKLAGKCLLQWVLDTLEKVQIVNKKIIIYGYKGNQIVKTVNNFYNASNCNLQSKFNHNLASIFDDYISLNKNFNVNINAANINLNANLQAKTKIASELEWVLQKEQLGTGHAVLQALPNLNDVDRVIILSGDVPLIDENTLKNFINKTGESSIGLVCCKVANPFGLGRIIRDKNGEILKIVEEKDADEKTKEISEINAGIYIFPTKFLKAWLPSLKTNNTQKEYYLTDLISIAFREKVRVIGIGIEDEKLVTGVNDRYQLMQLERYVQEIRVKSLMIENGVSFLDPSRVDIRTDDLEIGKDVVIDVNVILEGKIRIADGVYIGPNTIIKDCEIGKDTEILPHSLIESSIIGNNCKVGPFARVRPNTVLKDQVKIGNFVEVKKSIIGNDSKVNHLSYIGDSLIGEKVNIGAGTITCNYDGVNKHQTIIEDDVFVGSDSQLIAPVRICKGATIAAGTTLTRDAPSDGLTITRKMQRTIERWQRPKKLKNPVNEDDLVNKD